MRDLRHGGCSQSCRGPELRELMLLRRPAAQTVGRMQNGQGRAQLKRQHASAQANCFVKHSFVTARPMSGACSDEQQRSAGRSWAVS